MVIGDVIARLKDWGIESVEESAIQFPYDKVVWEVKNRINCDEIPEGLEHITIDMVCAEYLKMKNALGTLTELEIESVATSISMGDSNVSFGDSTPEQKFDALLEYMLTGHDEDFIAYRKLVW